MPRPRRLGGTLMRAGRGEQHRIAEPDFAAVGHFEAGDAAQQRGLAASGRAEQGEEVAILDRQAHAVERRAVALAAALAPRESF